MVKLGAIEFDECILDALRDGTLVIFAGAGVSMGPPSNLASFERLVNEVAQGTGLVVSEPLDRFLGQLQHLKVNVHERAAQLLSPLGSAPNALHYDLLRMFRAADRVRLVTTNFDLHFETAAKALFPAMPETYRAPALPLGYNFSGIVHLHGALPHAQNLVLTDVDFGRAYLTEGWARRFLVDAFRRYTVLFVGYSHNDVVMNYLARALPASGVAGRFALTGEVGSWDLLGIKPIRFNTGSGANAYKELYDGVQKLSERSMRGALDWQTRLTDLGRSIPPADDEAVGEVEQALREVHTTRFFVGVARDAEWPRWLDARNHLDALFDTPDLSERDRLLAWWLAENFAIEHPETFFTLIAAHGLRMNSALWWAVGRELGVRKDKPLDDSALKRWVTILLASVPPAADHHVLMWLAERCASNNIVALTLKVFLHMIQHRLVIRPSIVWYDIGENKRDRRLDADCILLSDHWSLNEIWINHLQRHMEQLAQPLLSGITSRLEEIHGDLAAWDKASADWDPISYGRSAIEPHEQDRYQEAIDVVIDSSREALEWLATNSATQLDAWIERHVTSIAPLLRRLSIHAVMVHAHKSADERLTWLLERVGLHVFAEHHEVHRLAALNYAAASDSVRRDIVDAVFAHILPASDDISGETRTARAHFDWLCWLLQSKPDCGLAALALEPIKTQFPDWQPSEHADLTHWTGSAEWVGSQSPWSVEQLLASEPHEQIEDLLTFNERRFNEPDRNGLILAVREACQQKKSWGFTLAEVLIERSLWTSDLWPSVIGGLKDSDIAVDGWHSLLQIAVHPELHTAHPDEVASMLDTLVRDGGKPFALELLDDANVIALPVWGRLEHYEQDENIDDWLSRAINRPAGKIVEFWINGLSLFLRNKSGSERILPENYRQWFKMVLQDPTSKGGMGRCLLASRTAFLFNLDETWTRHHILPLFLEVDRQKFAQAWDGFLVWGRLYPALVEELVPAFIYAIQPTRELLPKQSHRFVEFYTALSVIHVTDPLQQLLPALFQHGTLDDRIGFASHLGYFLRQMQPDAKQLLWDRWLRVYWQSRLQGILAVLDEAEIRRMLEWLPYLEDSFPSAVALTVRAPMFPIESCSLLYTLRDSDLVTRYPEDTAELLIYLCNCVVTHHAADLGRVASRLTTLPPAMKRRLDEGLAHIGVNLNT